MRNWALSVLAAALSTTATAATVTYNVSGSFTESAQYGPNGPALAAELGAPMTYEASFTFDAAAPNQTPGLNNQGFFLGLSATVKVDGVTLFTSSLPGMLLNNPVANSNYGPESLILTAASPQRVGAEGSETTSFQAILVFPLNTLTSSQLPTAANSFDAMTRNLAALGIGPTSGPSRAIRRSAVTDDQLMTVSITPAPEPGEWVMIAAGLGIVGAVAQRRRRP